MWEGARHTENHPGCGMFEDDGGIFEVEFLVDDCRRVHLHSVKCDVFLVLRKEACSLRIVW